MNNLSFSELCCLFCCPPCPGKIASKLAFLPPDPTYTLMCDESGSRWTLHLSDRADWQYSSREKDAIECFMTRTSKGNRIACMFVRCSPNAKYTLLFSHGNAVDLGQMSSFYIGLGSRINCNIFSYDYSGYGASSGKPTEKNLYADIDAAWVALRTSAEAAKITEPLGSQPDGEKFSSEKEEEKKADASTPCIFSADDFQSLLSKAIMDLSEQSDLTKEEKEPKPKSKPKGSNQFFSRNISSEKLIFGLIYKCLLDKDKSKIGNDRSVYALRYGIRPENVIIYGQSIGTVPSVDLAARYESAAVILHSPLTSGMRVAFPDTKKTYCFDAFPNIDKISKITSPVLIIHGTEDEVIDFSHGLALFERCQRPVEPLWVEGAGHNDVELYGQYLERLKQFVSQELVNL
uniref:Alpha/beta hydrolase domain-containing protein 17B n=1 Tax=Sphaerodactylus townsendi TaxID=933632 RepID=A0ACB8ERN0_9SAUR